MDDIHQHQPIKEISVTDYTTPKPDIDELFDFWQYIAQ